MGSVSVRFLVVRNRNNSDSLKHERARDLSLIAVLDSC